MEIYHSDKTTIYIVTLPKMFITPDKSVHLHITCYLYKSINKNIKKWLFGEYHYKYKIDCPCVNWKHIWDGELYTDTILNAAKTCVEPIFKSAVQQLNNNILSFDDAESLISVRLRLIENEFKNYDSKNN